MASADVVIVGGGAVGCAAAYFLTRQGFRPVVVEKDAIGAHASGFAFGGLSAFGSYSSIGAIYPLTREAMRLHVQLAKELREQTGIDTHFHPTSILTPAVNDEERQQQQARLAWLLSEGYAARWLDGEAARRLEPRLASSLLGVVQVEGAALVESYRYCLALAQAAEQGGARFRHGEVQSVRVENGRVTAVETRSDTIPCENAVIAAGPWTGLAGAWLGAPVPVRPLKGQIVRLRLPGAPIEYEISWRGNYFASKSDGLIWAGTTEEEVGFDETPTSDGRDTILTTLATVFPALLDAEIVMQTACLRPLSADGLPIIGPVPDIGGLVLATGAGRRGILLSAVMGSIAADLVAKGKTDLPIEPFSLERFAGGNS
ncbi:MAG: FAD-dependent oxidoreductase [Chloroflexi bacterium]|nr:FAD-dependent oxidoreductase [Chloroflexota bacterium]